MKRRLLVAAALVVLVGVATFVPGNGRSVAAWEREGALLAGSWYWQTWLPVAPGQQVPLPALVTYQQDGTVTVADGLMFGGIPSNPFRYTPPHGVWERDGRHGFRGTALFLRFDAATGTLVAIGRSRSHFDFGPDFNHINGTVDLDLLPCGTPVTCPDPVSAAPEQWLPFGPISQYSFTATRMHVVRTGQ